MTGGALPSCCPGPSTGSRQQRQRGRYRGCAGGGHCACACVCLCSVPVQCGAAQCACSAVPLLVCVLPSTCRLGPCAGCPQVALQWQGTMQVPHVAAAKSIMAVLLDSSTPQLSIEGGCLHRPSHDPSTRACRGAAGRLPAGGAWSRWRVPPVWGSSNGQRSGRGCREPGKGETGAMTLGKSAEGALPE
jgi:hypothetical protein